MLIRRSGDAVLSRVLAGTIRRDETATDSELAITLLKSGKDLEEHEFAVSSVATSLALHCTDMKVPSTPRVLRLSNVVHLATDMNLVEIFKSLGTEVKSISKIDDLANNLNIPNGVKVLVVKIQLMN